MKTIFAPGCALHKYKPDLIEKIRQFLLEREIIDEMSLTCCKDCTACVRSFSVTDKTPRHLLDLLFNEPTEGLTIE